MEMRNTFIGFALLVVLLLAGCINAEQPIEPHPNPNPPVSDPIDITEPDPIEVNLCEQKVTGKGVCEAYREGYEFNPVTNSCEQIGVSGCSFKVPFETLEECQQTCAPLNPSPEPDVYTVESFWEQRESLVGQTIIIEGIMEYSGFCTEGPFPNTCGGVFAFNYQTEEGFEQIAFTGEYEGETIGCSGTEVELTCQPFETGNTYNVTVKVVSRYFENLDRFSYELELIDYTLVAEAPVKVYTSEEVWEQRDLLVGKRIAIEGAIEEFIICAAFSYEGNCGGTFGYQLEDNERLEYKGSYEGENVGCTGTDGDVECYPLNQGFEYTAFFAKVKKGYLENLEIFYYELEFLGFKP